MNVNAADYIIPPSPSMVYQYASTTTHAVNAVPDNWKNRYVTIFALTADVYILFGTASNIEVDRAATPTNGTGATYGKPLSTNNLAGYPFYIDEKWTHFAIESGASATIRVEVSSAPSTGVPYQPRSAVGGT